MKLKVGRIRSFRKRSWVPHWLYQWSGRLIESIPNSARFPVKYHLGHVQRWIVSKEFISKPSESEDAIAFSEVFARLWNAEEATDGTAVTTTGKR